MEFDRFLKYYENSEDLNLRERRREMQTTEANQEEEMTEA
jgi:hypothetical protein